MASTNSTVDGMGFEEVGQIAEADRNLWLTGSVVAEAGIKTDNFISGNQVRFEDVVVNDDLTCNVLSENNNDRVYSTSIQNATELFGYKVKAGSVLIGDDSSGLIAFVSAGSFSTTNYFMNLSPRNWTVPIASTTGSVNNFSISGIRRASGCWAYGPSGTEADWIAVGI